MARSSARSDIQRTSVRCAIYTRKSTEEGLDQAFNSLDAQREACAAYILSQRHEGWVLLSDLYDDGGYSGGTMERPGLRQLLAEVEAGKVDVIVVYKVDRLTRSLADFAKIVEVLDARGASFVSITQSFNTTTSMGRLTLNVLLSFAQFEREVISERVRDKVAASKKKGMWMGGPVPLGYDVVAGKLIVNDKEAGIVRHIFQRYLEVGTVPRLIEALAAEGIRSKRQEWSNGRSRGGTPLGRGALHHLLTNRLYRGEIRHRDQVYPGEHQAIVPQELWEAVQARLAQNGVDRKRGVNARDPSLLVGRIVDHEGRRMAPSHATKGPLRYRYYATAIDTAHRSDVVRVPAGDVEQAIIGGLVRLLSGGLEVITSVATHPLGAGASSAIAAASASLARSLPTMGTADQRRLLDEIDLRASISGDMVAATIDLSHLAIRLGIDPTMVATDSLRHRLPIDGTIASRGHEMRMVATPHDPTSGHRDGRLIALLLKAEIARKQLFDAPSGNADSDVSAYGAKHVARLARLAFLAPDIVAAILDGTQPPSLTARRVLRASEIPIEWNDQRRLFGFG